MRIAQALQIGVFLVEVLQMPGLGRQVAVAPGQIAVDAVSLDALAHDLHGLDAHALELGDSFLAEHGAELLDVVANSADQLAAVAAAGAPADSTCFEKDDRESALGQFDGGIQPAEAAADHADVGALLAFQAGQVEFAVAARSIVGRGVVGLGRRRGAGVLFGSHAP